MTYLTGVNLAGANHAWIRKQMFQSAASPRIAVTFFAPTHLVFKLLICGLGAPVGNSTLSTRRHISLMTCLPTNLYPMVRDGYRTKCLKAGRDSGSCALRDLCDRRQPIAHRLPALLITCDSLSNAELLYH